MCMVFIVSKGVMKFQLLFVLFGIGHVDHVVFVNSVRMNSILKHKNCALVIVSMKDNATCK